MSLSETVRGTQWISHQQLADDVLQWVCGLPEQFVEVVGIPRSGLTVAHLAAAALNIPARQLGCAAEFRQSTGRSLTSPADGVSLIVDDTVSTGAAMQEARSEFQTPRAIYGTPYARVAARQFVDRWFKVHAEPDWLVVTQWNFLSHQDTDRIAFHADTLFSGDVTKLPLWRCPAGIVADPGQASAVKQWLRRRNIQDCLVVETADIVDGLTEIDRTCLYVTEDEQHAKELAAKTSLAVLSTQSWRCQGASWPWQVYGIGMPRTGTASLCSALIDIGYRTRHNPLSWPELLIADAAADIFVTINYRELHKRFPQSVFVLTTRDESDWLASITARHSDSFWLDSSNPVWNEFKKTILGTYDRTDSSQLLQAFRRHRHDVEEYFRQQGGRLLVLDCDSDWQSLYDFLGVARPPGTAKHRNNKTTTDTGIRNC